MSKILNKEQLKIKEQRDKIRQEYLSELKAKGIQKTDATSKRSGYSGGGGTANSGCGSSSTSSSFSSSSLNNDTNLNTSTITGAYSNSGLYLKPTQVGFDSFFAIGRYPVSLDSDGITRTYGRIIAIDIRYVTDYVSDIDSAINAFDNTDSYYNVGDFSSYEGDYSQDYWHFTPELESGYSYQQVIKVRFGNSTGSGLWAWTDWYFWSSRVSLNILASPSVSYNQNTNVFTISNGTGYKCVEFNRSGYNPYSNYLTSVEKDICYNCSVRNQEYGIYYGQVRQANNFSLWDVGTYTVKLVYDLGHPSETRTRFSYAVNNWISQMNSLLNNVTFVRNDSTSNPDILIETKSNSAIGSSEDYVYAGLWENETDSEGWIVYAYIQLNYEIDKYDGLFNSVEHVATEELYQACGCGGDLTTRADCINTDFNWSGKIPNGNLTTIDEDIISFLYNSDIYKCVGLGSEALAVAMNPSNGFLYTSGTTCSPSWVEENVTYNMRVWCANSADSYSVVPSYSKTFTRIIPISNVKIYMNGVWISCPVKVYVNGTWQTCQVKYHDGSSWTT